MINVIQCFEAISVCSTCITDYFSFGSYNGSDWPSSELQNNNDACTNFVPIDWQQFQMQLSVMNAYCMRSENINSQLCNLNNTVFSRTVKLVFEHHTLISRTFNNESSNLFRKIVREICWPWSCIPSTFLLHFERKSSSFTPISRILANSGECRFDEPFLDSNPTWSSNHTTVGLRFHPRGGNWLSYSPSDHEHGTSERRLSELIALRQ